LHKIKIRSCVAIIGGIYHVKSKGDPKIVARDILVEDILIVVCVRKFKEKSVDVEIVQVIGILSKDAPQQGVVCHSYK